MRGIVRLAAIFTISGCSQEFFGLGGQEASFRPESPSYTLQTTTSGLRGDIPFAYTNRTGRNVYVVNCNRIVPPVLEKRVNDRWVTAWGAAVPQCLSEPIVIRHGETYRDTLNVFAGHPGSNVDPKFDVPEIEGVYRMRWEGVLWSFDASNYPFGPEVPRDLRTSSEFRIEVQD